MGTNRKQIKMKKKNKANAIKNKIVSSEKALAIAKAKT